MLPRVAREYGQASWRPLHQLGGVGVADPRRLEAERGRETQNRRF
jgi:hypothetical protein